MNGSYNYFHQIWWAMYKRWAKIISYLYRLNLFQQYKLLVSIKDLLKKIKFETKIYLISHAIMTIQNFI